MHMEANPRDEIAVLREMYAKEGAKALALQEELSRVCAQRDLAELKRSNTERMYEARIQELDTTLRNARDFIESSAFNVPTKDYFDAVLKDIDAALGLFAPPPDQTSPMTVGPEDYFEQPIVDRLRERAKAAREEKNATALSDALHFEQAASDLERLQLDLAFWKSNSAAESKARIASEAREIEAADINEGLAVIVRQWRERAEEAEAKLEKAREALWEIEKWQRAYPLSVFPEPDFDRARELLEAGGITLDAISASNMRHVLDGVGEIVRATLKEIGESNGRS